MIKKCRIYFDTILARTGQNNDYNLNGVFFRDLELDDPEVYLNAVGADLGETMGNIIAKSYMLSAPETEISFAEIPLGKKSMEPADHFEAPIRIRYRGYEDLIGTTAACTQLAAVLETLQQTC